MLLCFCGDAFLPVVDVVEQKIQLLPGLEPSSLGDQPMVGIVELVSETTEHPCDGQVKLMVAIE